MSSLTQRNTSGKQKAKSNDAAPPVPTHSTSPKNLDKLDTILKIAGVLAFLLFLVICGILIYLIIKETKLISADQSFRSKRSKEKAKIFDEDTSQHTNYKIGYEYPFIVGEVKRIKVDRKENFAEKIAKAEEPVILTGTAVDDWPARKLWNPDYFAKYSEKYNNCQKHPRKTFWYYHPQKSMAPYDLEYKEIQTWEKVNLTSLEFFQKVTKPPPYYYYASQLQDLGDFFESDVNDTYSFIVKDDYFNPSMVHKSKWTNVWFGGGGATTQAHFDVYHNFYAQVYGRKRFILFAPDQHPNLYIYPFLHPAALQSQVDFDNPDFDKFPNFKNAHALQAILTPGDVLYIPPMYFHHVTAIDTSLSVSMWSKASESKMVQATWQSDAQLPFMSSWPKPLLHFAVRYFLEQVIDSVFEKGYSKVFIANLLAERYEQVMIRIPSLLSTETSFCKNAIMSESDQIAFAMEISGDEKFTEKIADYAQVFKNVPNLARRELWLGNLCEQVAFTVVGMDKVGRLFTDMATC